MMPGMTNNAKIISSLYALAQALIDIQCIGAGPDYVDGQTIPCVCEHCFIRQCASNLHEAIEQECGPVTIRLAEGV